MTLSPASMIAGRRRQPLATLARAAMLLGVLVLSACAGGDEPFVAEPLRPAAELYAEGMANLEAGRVRDAIDNFEALDRQYPYSANAKEGLQIIAFAEYELGDFEAALAASERFLRIYPTSEGADGMLYIKGESLLRQVPDVTRDQDVARQALQADQELLDRYPNSQYADEARLNIVAINDQLAGQEMLVGRYYLERREYVAAVNRFRLVVEEYDTTRHVEEALYRLTEAYLAMGLVAEAQTAASVLGNNFPASEWYQRAYNLLGAGGLEPRRGGGNWLNGLFR